MLSIERLMIPCSSRKNTRNNKNLLGWNAYVKDKRDKAIFWHKMWKDAGSPKDGAIADLRRSTRAEYHKAIKFGILVCIIRTQFPIAWCQYDKHLKVHRTPHRCSYFLWAILNKKASIWLKFGNMIKEHCRFIFIAPWRFAPNLKVPKALFSILGGHLQVQTIYLMLK